MNLGAQKHLFLALFQNLAQKGREPSTHDSWEMFILGSTPATVSQDRQHEVEAKE